MTLLLPFSIIVLNFLPRFAKDIVPKYIFNYYIEPDVGYYIYTIYLISIILYGFILLFKFLKKLPDIKETQAKYIIMASAMGFTGGCSVFLLAFNIFLPPYLLILFTTFPLAIVYATTKHHLFDIKIIATELLIVAIWILLLAKSFFSTSSQDIILNISILLSVIIVGVLLIRSVVKEVELREKVAKALEGEKKANDSLELFMTGLQHDIRGYLTPIISAASSLIDGSGAYSKFAKGGVLLNEDGINMVKIFEKNAIGAKNQADDFMTIAEFRQGKPILSLDSAVELGSILEELVSSFKTLKAAETIG